MNWKLVSILFFGLLFRIFLIPVARHGDINNNTSWGQLLLTRGPNGFYEQENWTYSAPNQPPLYLVLFGSTAFFQNTINTSIHWANDHISVFPSKTIWWFDSWGELYIAKLPGIFADLGIAFVIYKLIKAKKGLILATVWLLNPVSWYNSAIWGGTDSIVNLIGLVSLSFLYKKKLESSAVFFTLSVLFKGSLLIFAPFWLLVAFRQKFTMREWKNTILMCLLVFLLFSLPFHFSLNMPIWFFNLYTQRFLPGEIGTVTANAFNFWWMASPSNVLDNVTTFGISMRIIGLAITIVLAIPLIKRILKSPVKINQFIIFAVLSFVSFFFMTRIHERYLYPFFPLATVSLAFFPWLWVPYVLLSLSHLLNLYNLFWAPGIPSLESIYTNPSLPQALSILNGVILLVVFVFLLVSKKNTASHGK